MKKEPLAVLTVCLIALILICMTKYVILRNCIEFINSNESRQILWGQILSEFDFVKKNSFTKGCKIIFNYDDTIVNIEQKLQESIYYKDERIAIQNFKLEIIDRDPPVIEYKGSTIFEAGQNINIEDYLFVHDDRNQGELQYVLKAQSELDQSEFGYTYTCGSENESCPFRFNTEGIYDLHVYAWDGHGNNSYKSIEIKVVPHQ